MAYAQGSTIEAIDFNTFRSQLLNIYGVGYGNSGYGQTAITVPAVLDGYVEVVKSTEWLALRDAIQSCASHQGTATTLLPSAGDVGVGQVITAHDGITDSANFVQMLTNITTNKLVASPLNMTQTVRHTDSFTGSWTSSASTEVNLRWPTADAARYFFNTGGSIVVNGSFVPSTVTPQNTSWQVLLSESGNAVVNHITTTTTGVTGVAYPIGYYSMSTTITPSIVFTASPPTGGGYEYSANQYKVTMRVLEVSGLNGDNGAVVRVRIDLLDNFALGGDGVSGTLTLNIEEQRATGPIAISAPNTFAVEVVSALTAT